MTATLIPVTVPDIGDFTGVPVIEILVNVGDQIAVDDPLVTLESDKASMDVPSPVAGTVAEIHVQLGDPVSEGSLLLSVSTSAGDDGEPSGEAPAPVLTGPDAIPSELIEPDSHALPAAEQATAGQAAPAATGASVAVDGDGVREAGPIYASPSVRRIARELGVPLAGVAGSGRKGRITVEDVESAQAARGAPAATAGTRALCRSRAWRWPPGRAWTSSNTGRSSGCHARASRRSRLQPSLATT